MDSPFSRQAAAVTFSGASPAHREWIDNRMSSKPRMPSLSDDESVEEANLKPRGERKPFTLSVYTPETPKVKKRRMPAKPCNCKRSKCLKLYCECFAAGVYCKGCNCGECLNVTEMDVREIEARAVRRQERDGPDEFTGRVRHCDADGTPAPKSRKKQTKKEGCFCKRSRCLKKYCECFQAGGYCDVTCHCDNCLNYVGSLELSAARAKHKIETPVKASKESSSWRLTCESAQRRKLDASKQLKLQALLAKDRAVAAEAAARAASSLPRQKLDDDSIAVALRIATAAAFEGTRVAWRSNCSEHDEIRVAQAVATATYGAVLETHNQALATRAADWGHAAARAAQRARSSGKDEASVEVCAREEARQAAQSNDAYRRHADTLVLAANKAATRAKRAEASLRPRVSDAAYAAHALHVATSNARDGPPATCGLPRPLALKMLQCLPNEDLYGSCLVDKTWNRLALDTALWTFFD